LNSFLTKGENEMSKVYFMHVRNIENDQISNYGGITIAYREIIGGVEFAEAWCSSKDNFNKAYGRAKAQGRLNSDRYLRKFSGTFNDFRRAIVDGQLV
jgi:hypothetical protein